MITTSSDHQKTLQTGTSERFKSGNPPSQHYGILALMKLLVQKREICVRYKIRQESFEVLMVICYRWMSNNNPSTAFSLSVKKDRGDKTAIQHKITRLVVRDLIEVIGKGKAGCYTYAPTRKGMSVIDELFPV